VRERAINAFAHGLIAQYRLGSIALEAVPRARCSVSSLYPVAFGGRDGPLNAVFARYGPVLGPQPRGRRTVTRVLRYDVVACRVHRAMTS
jgi:hypothetical protein